MRKWIYGKGCPFENEPLYTHTFEKHVIAVRKYFVDRPTDFLEMNIIKGEGWEKLCPFLGINAPTSHFPHENKRDN